MLVKNLLLVALFWPIAAVATPVGPVTDIVVVETGIGADDEGCSTYALTADQVHAFLERAVLISARQQHDHFLHGPCAVRGTLESRYDTWYFEIRSLGTGTLRATNGEVFLLGDPAQESGLDE